MSLFLATFLFAVFSLFLGLLVATPSGNRILNKANRSTLANFIFFGAALAWFLYEITLLGPEDFGQYKTIMLWIFAPAGLAAFYYIPDFLSIRGMTALALLSSRMILDAAYLEPYESRLFLVSGVYVLITLSLYLGACPYRYRDALEALDHKPHLRKLLGFGLLIYGILLTVLSFTYL